MNNILKNKGNFIIILTSIIIPLFLWSSFYFENIFYKFNTKISLFTTISQITGVIGFLLFAINIIISVRSKFIENIFGSLPDLYKTHKWIGIFSFLFLSFHPFFIFLNLADYSISYALKYIFSFSDIFVSLGKISLYLMFFIIFTSMFMKMKYNNWNLLHKILSSSFFFGFAHVLFINGAISKNIFLKNYLIFFGVVSLSAFVYKVLFNLNLNKIYKYKIINIKKINNILDIELSPISQKINFKPGQFVFMSLDKEKLKENHPFSISSSNKENNLKLSIKQSGDYTNDLEKNIKIDDEVFIEGAYGNFYRNRNRNKIFIAGGIGVTPFISVLRSEEIKNNTTLFYCLKNENEAIFLEELKNIEKNNSNFKLIEIYSSKRDRINLEDFKNININNSDIFMCGPILMMKDLNNKFIKKGISKDLIHFEDFSFR